MTGRIVCFARSAALSLIVLVLSSPPASAQATAPAPQVGSVSQTIFLGSVFAQLVQTREIWVTTSDGARRKARIGQVSLTSLDIQVKGGAAESVAFDRIVRLEKVKHRLRNRTLVGLTVGSLFGLLGAAFCESSAGCASSIFLTYSGFGAGVGAISGAIKKAANREEDLLYDVGRRATTMAVTPILSPTRKGVAFSMSWR